VLVVVRLVVALAGVQEPRHAPDGEVARDDDCPGAEVNHLLRGGADAGDHVGDVLIRLLARLIPH
jgi:hypothetical protein